MEKTHSHSFFIKTVIFFILVTFSTSLKAHECHIPNSLRFAIEREENASPIVYYFSSPDIVDRTYPILILCEGSSSKKDVESVFFIREYLASLIKERQSRAFIYKNYS